MTTKELENRIFNISESINWYSKWYYISESSNANQILFNYLDDHGIPDHRAGIEIGLSNIDNQFKVTVHIDEAKYNINDVAMYRKHSFLTKLLDNCENNRQVSNRDKFTNILHQFVENTNN